MADHLNNETPTTVHGRLMEAVHISGYSLERACSEFEWLLDENRWQQVGTGFTDFDAFAATIDFSEFKLAIEQRKRLAAKMAALHASQRATAKALGVGHQTIGRDLNGPSGPRKADPAIASEPSDGPNGTPAWFQRDLNAAKLARRRGERITRDEVARFPAIDTVTGEIAGGLCDLRLGDFREVLATVPDGTVDLILTDPPYPAEYLPLWSDLGAFAKRVLKPDGLLVAMSGQIHLLEVAARLSEHLPYRWLISYLMPGGANVVHARKVSTMWKPVLVYGSGERRLFDVVRSDQASKEHHDWGQSESGMAALLDLVAGPGILVCDPFAGGGTTALVAIAAGCSFIGAEIDAATYAAARARLNNAGS